MVFIPANLKIIFKIAGMVICWKSTFYWNPYEMLCHPECHLGSAEVVYRRVFTPNPFILRYFFHLLV